MRQLSSGLVVFGLRLGLYGTRVYGLGLRTGPW